MQALDYLLKPVSYKAFKEVMERALKQRVESSKKYIRVKIRNATIQSDEFRHLAEDFKVTLPEKFLFEKH